jgi:molybdate transport system ATP-binding protein
MSAGLHAQVQVRRREFNLDVTVQAGVGEVLAVLGRNGSGKSTLLAAIAGLLRPDEGQITLEGRVLTDTAAKVQSPPHRRRIGLLAQQPLLFPHLSVLDNVAFGPRSTGTSRRDALVKAAPRRDSPPGAHAEGHRVQESSASRSRRCCVVLPIATPPRRGDAAVQIRRC